MNRLSGDEGRAVAVSGSNQRAGISDHLNYVIWGAPEIGYSVRSRNRQDLDATRNHLAKLMVDQRMVMKEGAKCVMLNRQIST